MSPSNTGVDKVSPTNTDTETHVSDKDTFDEESIQLKDVVEIAKPMNMAVPGSVYGRRSSTASQHTLGEVSAMFDRDGKGYLDPTERALRRMDTQNKGFLDIDKVYFIMQSLQEEQKKSSALIDTIREEQKKSMNLKKGVIALAVFAVLLALANVGTSFVAAKLAKDTYVSQYGDLVIQGNGERVATTAKLATITINPVDSQTRRRLQTDRNLKQMESFGCRNTSNGTLCEIQGTLNYDDALQLYWQFCPGWFFGSPCRGGGAAEIEMICNGVPSTIYGASKLPRTPPSLSDGYMYFPTTNAGFLAEQTFSEKLGGHRCVHQYDMSILCPTDGSACFAFAHWEEETVGCGQPINLCG